MTEECRRTELAERCLIVENVPYNVTDTELLTLFPNAHGLSWATTRGSEVVAIVLFAHRSEACLQLSSPLRQLEDKQTVKITRCPSGAVPDAWVNTPDQDFCTTPGASEQDWVISDHIYPGAGAIVEQRQVSYVHHQDPVIDEIRDGGLSSVSSDISYPVPNERSPQHHSSPDRLSSVSGDIGYPETKERSPQHHTSPDRWSSLSSDISYPETKERSPQHHTSFDKLSSVSNEASYNVVTKPTFSEHDTGLENLSLVTNDVSYPVRREIFPPHDSTPDNSSPPLGHTSYPSETLPDQLSSVTSDIGYPETDQSFLGYPFGQDSPVPQLGSVADNITYPSGEETCIGDESHVDPKVSTESENLSLSTDHIRYPVSDNAEDSFTEQDPTGGRPSSTLSGPSCRSALATDSPVHLSPREEKLSYPDCDQSPPPSYNEVMSLAQDQTPRFTQYPETPRAVLDDQERELNKLSHRMATNSEAVPSHCIKVTGLPDGVNDEFLNLYFGNKRRNGGGEVQNVRLNHKDHSAVIEFVDPKAVDIVLQKCPLLMKDKKIDIEKHIESSHDPSRDLSEENCVVKVTGVPSSVSKEYLELYFDNEKKSGGGEIEELVYNIENGSARISFKRVKVADRVLGWPRHELGETVLTVSRWQRPVIKTVRVTGFKPATTHDYLELKFDKFWDVEDVKMLDDGSALVSFVEEEDCQKVLQRDDITLDGCPLTISVFLEEETEDEPNTILVSGIKPGLSEELIKLYFENEKKSRGGDVKDLKINGDGTALVSFMDKKIAQRVLAFGQTEGLKLGGKVLSASPWKPSCKGQTTKELKPSVVMDTIKIEGIPAKISRETISLYFENSRRSGGGEIVKRTDCEDGTMLISFSDPKVVTSVLSRDSHTVEGVRLKVQPYIPPPPVLLDPCKVFIEGVPEETTRDCLSMFIEARCGVEPERFVDGEKLGTYMLMFSEEIKDLPKFQQSCEDHPIEGSHLSVHGVPVSTCIRVTNIHPKVTKDSLRLHFESKRRSDGGPVSDVQLFKDDDYALVDFVDCDVVDRVLSKDQTLENQKLSVCVHYKCLGLVSLDGTGVPVKLPEPVTMQLDPYLLKFFHHSQIHKEAFEHQLNQTVPIRMEWPKGQATVLKVNCNLEPCEKNRRHISRFKDTVTNGVNGFLEMYHTEAVNCLQETWSMVKEGLQSDEFDMKAGGLIIPVDQSNTVVVAGLRQRVEQCKPNIEKLKQAIEDDLETRKKIITEVKSLKHYELLFLKMQSFKEAVESKNVRCKISFNFPKGHIEFQGLPTDIESAKVAMYESLEKKRSTNINISSCLADFILCSEVKKYLSQKLKERNVKAVWDTKGTELSVIATTDKHMVEGAQIIKASLVETVVPIKEESSPLLSSPKWHGMVTNMENSNTGLVRVIPAPDKRQVNIVTTDNLINGIMEVIKDFLRANTILCELCQVDYGTALFISQYKGEEISVLEESLKQDAVSVKVLVNTKPPGVQVKGTEQGIQQAKARLEEVTTKIISRRYHLQKPGYPKHLRSRKGKEFLNNVESSFSVIIRESSEQDAAIVEEDFVVVPKPSLPKHTVTASVGLANNRKVSVVLGDMTEYKVDAMVNAANRELKHMGGLACAISKKGGPSVQAESTAYVQKHGAVLEGSVAMTGPGNLPCQVLIHAVGPVWRGGHSKEEVALNEAIFESLELAGQKELRSITIPALSTGVFGYPLTDAVFTIVDAIREYLREEPTSSLQDVYLIDINPRTVTEFGSALCRVFGDKNVQKFHEKPTPTKRNLKWTNTKSNNGAPDYLGPLHAADAQTRSGLQITLIRGELAKQKADVLVNSTGRDMTLNGGAVSKSLLKAAGSEMQGEATQRYPNGFQPGDSVLVTKGYKLGCREVYHGSLPTWKQDTDTQAVQALQKFITDCLTKAQAAGYTSIMFPALGTGNLRFPDATVAKAMYGTVVQFSDKHPTSSIKKVGFVVYPASTATVKAFEDQEKSLKGLPHSSTKSKRRQNRSFTGTSSQGKSASASARPHGQGPAQEEEIFPIQDIRFSVSQGDITQSVTDAIINSSNERLDLKAGAVSKAILFAAGDIIQKECTGQEAAMVKEGYVVTRAGSLRCRHIIHMDAGRKGSWKSKVLKCLEAANKLEVASVTFPALGTGAYGQAPEKIAKDMFDAITEFQSQQEANNSMMSVKDVRLVVFEDTMVGSLKSGLLECFSKAGAKPKSWWRKAWSAVTGIFVDVASDEESNLDTSSGSGDRKKAPKEITLVITSDSKSDIERAIEKIDSSLKEEGADKTISDTWTESIRRLSKKDVDRILSFEEKLDVKIEVNQRMGRIRIQGMSDDYMKTYEKIIDILKEADKIIHQTEASEVLAGVVQWYYIEDDSSDGSVAAPPIKYDPNFNRILEKAFKDKKKSEVFETNTGEKFCYNFETMEEYPVDDPSDRVKMIRKELSSQGSQFEPPALWTPMVDKDLVTVDVPSTDQVYQDISTRLKGHVKQILKIERIQNISLYQQYMAKKGKIEKMNPANVANAEKILWHGTSQDTIQSINNYGFNRSYCGKNATMYGNGVYFAVNANYSAQTAYARPDSQGYKRMYQTKVLVGEYTQGRQGMIVPPAKSGVVLYDSVVDNTTTPGIFVIFHDAQAYPEYLITFT